MNTISNSTDEERNVEDILKKLHRTFHLLIHCPRKALEIIPVLRAPAASKLGLLYAGEWIAIRVVP